MATKNRKMAAADKYALRRVPTSLSNRPFSSLPAGRGRALLLDYEKETSKK
jgi:hypothetical protein